MNELIEAKLELITKKITRLETRVTRGFEELGVDTFTKENWLSVDPNVETIFITTMGRSLQVIAETAKHRGARPGPNKLVCEGRQVGILYL